MGQMVQLCETVSTTENDRNVENLFDQDQALAKAQVRAARVS
jgi:hypothetical protein